MNIKKEYWLVVALALIIVLLGAILFFVPKKSDQGKVKSGLSVLSVERKDVKNFANIKIDGYVNGDDWIPFEGQAGVVRFLDKDNKSLGYAILTIDGDWMATPPLKFIAKMVMTPWEADQVVNLEFVNENPSGDSTKEKKYVMPASFGSSGQTMKVKVFFGSKTADSTCDVVFPVERVVPKTTAVARAALEELLKGPTQEEKDKGYFSGINAGVKINRLVILDGTGIVDFSEEMNGGGGSCRVTEIRAEINSTLKQFSTIKEVIISVNGDTETALQP